MSCSVTTLPGAIPSNVAALTIRLRRVIGPSAAGAKGSDVAPAPQPSPKCWIAFPPRYFATVGSGTACCASVASASSTEPVSWFG